MDRLIIDGKLVVVTRRDGSWGSDRSFPDSVRACRVFDPELCRLVLEQMRTWREPSNLEREIAETRLRLYYLENLNRFKVRTDNSVSFPMPILTADLVDPTVAFEILGGEGKLAEKIVSHAKGPNTFNM